MICAIIFLANSVWIDPCAVVLVESVYHPMAGSECRIQLRGAVSSLRLDEDPLCLETVKKIREARERERNPL